MEKGLLFTYALTYGGAMVSLFRPFYGLLIYVCFAIVKPEAMWYWAVPEGNYSRIVAIALIVGWLLHGTGDWRLGRAGPVVWCLVAYLGWSLIGALLAPEQAVAFAFGEGLAKIVVPFVVGITLIQSLDQLKQLAWVIVLSLGYVAFELNLSYYEGFNRIWEIGFGGMDNNSVAIAMVTGMGTAFFLGLHTASWWLKVLAFAASGLMAHCVLFSNSRGGMLAMVITGAVSFLIIRKRPVHYLTFALAVALALRLAGPEVRERFLTTFEEEKDRDVSAQSRVELWADCWDSMLQRPVFGIGPDHWPLVAAEYGWPAGKEAHTLWLQTGAEQGFPGLFLLAGFYLICVKRLWPLLRERSLVPDPWLRGMSRGVIASLVGFAVSAQFVSLEGLELPYYITLIGAGVLKLCSLPAQPATPHAWNVRHVAGLSETGDTAWTPVRPGPNAMGAR